jgi:hypothetical protein
MLRGNVVRGIVVRRNDVRGNIIRGNVIRERALGELTLYHSYIITTYIHWYIALKKFIGEIYQLTNFVYINAHHSAYTRVFKELLGST